MIPRKNLVIATVVTAVFIATGPSFAGQGRGSAGPKTHPPKPAGATTTVAKGPSAGTVQHGSPKGPKSTSTMAGGAAAKAPKTTSTSPKSGTASAKATGKSTTTASAKKSEPARTATSTTSTTTLTPVQQKLQQNTNLASKLETRLPKGTDLMTAAEGFRNLGQFVAAVNVSNNLGIPFTQLKTKMVDDNMSLGQSIKTLRPESSSTVEANRAEYDARGMILESETTTVSATVSASTTTSTTTTTQPKKNKGNGNGSGSND